MSTTMPKFVNSPYFVEEPDNWHLKEGAPEEIKKEFEDYMKQDREAKKMGIDV